MIVKGRDLLTGGVPCYNVYRTKDARFIAVGALELKFWETCCDVLHRADLKARHWARGQEIGGADAMEVKAELDVIFSQQTLAQWLEQFGDADCCVTPILRTDEALELPLFKARRMICRKSDPLEGDYWSAGDPIKFRN